MDQLDGRTWRKSSYSGSNGGNCIEVTTTPGTVAVRDSDDPHGPCLPSPARTGSGSPTRSKRPHTRSSATDPGGGRGRAGGSENKGRGATTDGAGSAGQQKAPPAAETARRQEPGGAVPG